MSCKAGIVGTGRMAEVLGAALGQAPGSLCQLSFFLGRREERTRELAKAWGGEALGFGAPLPQVDLLLLAVRDDALQEVGQSLVRASWPEGPPKLVVHGSGSKGVSVLQGFRDLGCALGVLHPLFSLQPGMAMAGRVFVITGDAEARGFLEPLVRSLGALPRYVEDLDPALYHCAASMLANGTTALFAAGLDLLRKASGGALGVEEAGLLMKSSLQALERGNPQGVLTGPVQRGDLETVAAHLASLEGQPEAQGRLYRALMGFALSLAAQGGLEAGRVRDLSLLLEEEGKA